jgi:hypothetical protein
MKQSFLLFALMTTVLLGQTLEDKLKRLTVLINSEFSEVPFEQRRDEKLRQLQSPIKDEFETQVMFEKRKTDTANKAKELRNEYSEKIADAKRIFDQQINELKLERDQLLASSEQDAVSTFTIGTYDADNQQFPIFLTTTRESFNIPISLQFAREFKNTSSSLQAQGKKRLTADAGYEYYNWKIIFSGQIFLFGPQKGNQRYANAAAKPSLPPYLKTSVTFSEPSGNLKLDANETGEITVKITNDGKGSAFGFEVESKIENPNDVTISRSAYVGEIPSGQSRKAILTLRANSNVSDGKTTATISYNESNGFAPAGNKITFETKALIPPKIILADVGIEDNSNNGKIEPSEIVKVTARIQNTGRGSAENVKAKVSIGENVFLAGGSQSDFSIGTLESGKYADIIFSIYTNNRATGVPVTLSVTESYGRYGIASQTLPLI